MQRVVNTILASAERVGAACVTNVQLGLGVSRHFTEEAARQYFQALTQNTPMEEGVR
jgi:Zn finger protein HypA/HybF involved in hydrogenase expression